MKQALFVYGVLQYPEVLQLLLGRKSIDAAPGQLRDYRRCRIDLPGWQPFAAIYPAAGERVDGIILRDLDSLELATLDRFECVGEGLFRRQQGELIMAGKDCNAEFYFPAPGLLAHRNGEWDDAAFRTGLADYIERVVIPFCRNGEII